MLIVNDNQVNCFTLLGGHGVSEIKTLDSWAVCDWGEIKRSLGSLHLWRIVACRSQNPPIHLTSSNTETIFNVFPWVFMLSLCVGTTDTVSPDHIVKSTAHLSELKDRFLSNLKPKLDPKCDYGVSQSQFTAPADTIFAAVSISLFVDLQVVEQVTHRDSSLSHTACFFPNMQHIKRNKTSEDLDLVRKNGLVLETWIYNMQLMHIQ